MLQRSNDDMYASDNRYWSSPVAIPLVPDDFSVSIPVEKDQWTDVDGKFNRNGFDQTLHSIGNIGLTFGGGCFFVTGRSATFVVTKFEIR